MSDYEIQQKQRNRIVGIFAILAVVALVWLLYEFQDLPIKLLKIKGYQVYIQFPSTPGVEEKTPVRFCGFQVGKVIDVKPPAVLKHLHSEKFLYQSIVVINIDDKFDNIPKNVEPKLMTRGFGSSYLELRPRAVDVNAPIEFLVNGSMLQGSTAASSEFFPEETQEKIEELAISLKVFVDNLNDIIGDKSSKQYFKTTLANLAQATQEASMALKEFQQFSAKGGDMLTDATVQFQQISKAMVNVGNELARTSSELRQILEKVNRGDGTAGKLVNDARLYESLLENSRQLDILLEEMKDFTSQISQKGIPIKLK